jgi:ribonuclease III
VPLEEALGYRFRNPALLAEALTHKSHANERRHTTAFNERLEFLGDSVLGLAVSGYLFRAHPDRDEGFLSKTRAAIVSRPSLARWAGELRLGHHLALGVGENLTGGKDRQSLLANALEAVLGAVYLDGGLEPAEKIVQAWLAKLDHGELDFDYKTELQILVQRRRGKFPDYEVLEESGPEHSKTFTVRVGFGGKALGLGTAPTKKEAQQAAARNALDYLKTHKL